MNFSKKEMENAGGPPVPQPTPHLPFSFCLWENGWCPRQCLNSLNLSAPVILMLKTAHRKHYIKHIQGFATILIGHKPAHFSAHQKPFGFHASN